jgi:hypothetical protein
MQHPSTKRYVAIVDKAQPRHRIANAVAHLALGIGHCGLDEGSTYTSFKDKAGNTVAVLTDYPFIILGAKNAGQLRQIHQNAAKLAVPCMAYLANMFVGTPEEQRAQIEASTPEEHEYIGLVLFGDAEVLRQLTKRASLLD